MSYVEAASGGGVPGKADLAAPVVWLPDDVGTEYCGLNWAKLAPKAAGSWPPWNPWGNWAAGLMFWAVPARPEPPDPPVAARRDKMDLK